MLALVNPLHNSEHRTIDRNITSLSSLPLPAPSTSSVRSTRSAHRKPPIQQTLAAPAHQTSSSSLFNSSKSLSVPPAVAYDHFTARPNAAPQHLHFLPSSSTSSTLPTPQHDNTPTHLPHPPHPPLPHSSVDIHSYAPTELLKLLASLLTQIARTNDALSPADSAAHTLPTHSHSPSSDTPSRTPVWRSLTSASRAALANPASALTFHARNIPTITLEAYLLRILKYCPTTNEVFLALLVYFDRMSRLASEATGRTFVIDSYNVHRLVIAGVTVASKFFSDVFYTNSRYAKVGGLPQAELNQLELQFLLLNNFSLVISPEEMQRYAEQLVLFSQSQSQPQPHPSSPPSSKSTTTQLPHTPSTQFRSPPSSTSSGPARAMGAIDAYGGSVAPSRTPSMRALHTRDDDTSSIFSETSTETETEGGDTTDDEPTIRPPHSASSCCGDAEESQGEGVFRADGIPNDAERDDKDRDRGEATPELRAQRRVREVSEDVGMTSP
ncbi:cyclin-domain-containing protein [Boletus edulis BED1]|uniref:Cyclin-domain-containing protein n=1 Tax=Boletus edulis BED1 TaxID=1328754 RepID=A0AAD4C796_BOLED|nr:cyclin-domain-containing protein [Boletus edulis BED1]